MLRRWFPTGSARYHGLARAVQWRRHTHNTMKTILSSVPLLVSAAVIATATIVVLCNLRIVTPDALGLGAGIATSAGLLAMMARDLESKSCC